MLEDKQKQINKLRSNGSEAAVGVVQNGESKVSEEGGAKSSGMAEVLAESKEKDLMNSIELEFEQRNAELDRLFAENESRRRNREVPDYLCGMIVYLLIIDLGEINKFRLHLLRVWLKYVSIFKEKAFLIVCMSVLFWLLIQTLNSFDPYVGWSIA